MNKPIFAIDAMGGDFGPSVIVPGALDAAREYGFKALLVGRGEQIAEALTRMPNLPSSDLYEIVEASQVVEMRDKPSEVMRTKKDSSIQVACRMVKEGKAQAVISAGHSGATVASGMFILGRIPGVERPALGTLLPTEKQPCLLLDAGANVDCKPGHLLQFAIMGSIFAQDIIGHPAPNVGLLSIGEEEGKGNALVLHSYDLLKQVKSIKFKGNIEGRDLFTGDVQVGVCDGFVGNVVLKVSEGLATSMTRILRHNLLNSGILSKIGTLLATRAFESFKRVLDYAEYGGAPLLGLQALAIVCHGSSNSQAIKSALRMAADYQRQGTQERLVKAIAKDEDLARFARSIQS